MKSSHHRVNNAKAVIGLLIIAIAFAVFYLFQVNNEYFFTNPEEINNYLIYTFVGAGVMIGLFYLTSQTTHKESAKRKAVSKPVKASKKKKK